MRPTQVLGLAGSAIALIVVLLFAGSLFENVDADEIAVFQSPTGSMKVVTSPGWSWQGFAKITSYKRRGTIHFKQEEGSDGRLPVVFNDAGKGLIQGSITYELPLVEQEVLEIHKRWPSQEALESSLVKPALNKSIYMTGPLMSSYESYKERRPQLIQYVEDQVQNGVYLTRTYETEREDEFGVTDPATGKKPTKRVTVVDILRNQAGQPQRAEVGQLAAFNVKTFNFAIENLDYDAQVTDQIKKQQDITMAVQTSIAQAKQAEQDALTALKKGEANIAQTRAQQEVDKTAAVVQAEKARDVAKLRAEEAKFYEQEKLTRANADAEAARRMIAADGALDKKLATYERVQANWAEAFANSKNPLVPGVVMGGSGATGSNAVNTFMELLGAKAARDLAVDVTPGRQQ